jgi:hypothetical protein
VVVRGVCFRPVRGEQFEDSDGVVAQRGESGDDEGAQFAVAGG